MKKSLILSLMVMAITFLSFSVPIAPPGDYVVIVNKENPIATLSAGEAKLYFLRTLKNRWPGINKNIRLATRKSKCAEREAFYGTILKMTDTEVENYFSERQFQNAEKSPDKFGSDAEIVGFVEQEPGAIAFISAKSLTDDVKAKVKVVLTF